MLTIYADGPPDDISMLYSPLATKRSIRILALMPGPDDAPICCQVYQRLLDLDVPFFALSYTWGSPDVTKPIYCLFNETEQQCLAKMQVTVNLYDALRRLRQRDRLTPLWVDALCINQSNNDEKGHQVDMMREIYTHARIVHVWLGDLECAAEAYETIRIAHQFFTAEVIELLDKPYGDTLFQIHCSKLKEEGKPTLLDLDWTSIHKLLDLPWWRRKWVIQETVRAKRALMWFGTQMMSYEDMMLLFDRLAQFNIRMIPDDESKPTRHGLGCALSMFEIRHLRRPILGPIHLLHLLSKTIFFQCSDVRDHIYAVLGLQWEREDEDFDFAPDYTLSPEATYTRLAIRFLKQSNEPLYLLFYHANQTKPKVLDLPSWVPDWTRQDSTPKLSDDFIKPDPLLFRATLDTRPRFEISEQDDILTVRGFRFDTVKECVEIDSIWWSDDEEFNNSGLSEDYSVNWKMREWYKACGLLALDVGVPLDDHFHTALLCELCTSTTSSKHRIQNRELWGRIMSNLMVRNARAVGCALREDEAGLKEAMKGVAELEGIVKEAFNKFSLLRKFFNTDGRSIGQGPKDTKSGDIICLLYGGRVPYLIRPIGDGTFTFVGHCYVQGVMDGEALELGLPEQDFRLK